LPFFLSFCCYRDLRYLCSFPTRRSSDLIDQWQGDYPNPDVVKNDIKNGWAYLAESADGMTVGTIAIVDGPDHSYDTMKGNWLIEDRKSTRLNSRSRFDLVCRLLLEKKKN